MEQTFLKIDKVAISGQKIKISCRNSYDRKQIYEYASKKGLRYRSIIDYTQMYVNQNMKRKTDSQCCRDCDEFEVIFSGTPHSFIEINSKTNEK